MILTGNKITEEVLNGKIVIEPFAPAAVTTNSYDLTLGDKLVMYTDEVLDPKKEPHTRTFEIPDEGYEMKRGEFLLGCSNEFVGSDFYVPIVHAKSSIARLGLFIHITSGLFDIAANATSLFTCMRQCRSGCTKTCRSRRSRFGRPRAKSGFITASTRTTRDRWPRAFTKISNKGYFSSTKVTGPSLISPTAMSA